MLDLTRAGAQVVDGPIGALEVLLDLPATAAPTGLAVVAHPQPLLGGNALHKVPHFLARALAEAGWCVLRPNFRGVGATSGAHDAGIGETEDLLDLCRQARQAAPSLRLALVGFSFGAFVQARVARRLADAGTPAWRTCLAGMPSGEVEGGRRYDPPTGLPNALVIHGEEDAAVRLQAVFDWAHPEAHPVVVVPGADHFFSGRLHVLRACLLAHLRD